MRFTVGMSRPQKIEETVHRHHVFDERTGDMGPPVRVAEECPGELESQGWAAGKVKGETCFVWLHPESGLEPWPGFGGTAVRADS